MYISWTYLLQIFLIFHQLHFHANKVKFTFVVPFFKIHILLHPRFYYGKLPIIFFLAVFMEKFQKHINYVKRRVVKKINIVSVKKECTVSRILRFSLSRAMNWLSHNTLLLGKYISICIGIWRGLSIFKSKRIYEVMLSEIKVCLYSWYEWRGAIT